MLSCHHLDGFLVFNASWEGNTFMVLLCLTDMLVEAPFFIFPRLARRCQWWERLIINIIPVSAPTEGDGGAAGERSVLQSATTADYSGYGTPNVHKEEK